MSLSFDKTLSANEGLLWQIPGIFVLKDLHSNLFCNETSTKLFGYKNLDQVTGISDFDLKCDAVRFARQFIDEDQIVLNEKPSISIVYILQYADGNVSHVRHKKVN